jgi:hypothetical protein
MRVIGGSISLPSDRTCTLTQHRVSLPACRPASPLIAVGSRTFKVNPEDSSLVFRSIVMQQTKVLVVDPEDDGNTMLRNVGSVPQDRNLQQPPLPRQMQYNPPIT